jgi:hypothetical protein
LDDARYINRRRRQNRIQMSTYAFRPWIGPRYQAEGLSGVKLLILGESQYSGDADLNEPRRPLPSEADETKRNVEDLAINGPVQHRPFWTKVTKLLLNHANGEPISKVERAEVWNRVAFYNYLQWCMPAGRTKPTSVMWDEAREPFVSVVSELSPNLILVLGLRMQRHIPLVRPLTLCIAHPSRVGFTYGTSCIEVHAALEDARSRLEPRDK